MSSVLILNFNKYLQLLFANFSGYGTQIYDEQTDSGWQTRRHHFCRSSIPDQERRDSVSSGGLEPNDADCGCLCIFFFFLFNFAWVFIFSAHVVHVLYLHTFWHFKDPTLMLLLFLRRSPFPSISTSPPHVYKVTWAAESPHKESKTSRRSKSGQLLDRQMCF